MQHSNQVPDVADRCIGRIPLRNIWFLILYASDFARFAGRSLAGFEQDDEELPDLVARLLSREVERRLRRNLSRGYLRREMPLSRVRGRIDLLRTASGRLLDRGLVACRFHELTLDTPRNRFVRAALERIAHLVSDASLALSCRVLATSLIRAGVSGDYPSRAEISRERFGRNDSEDKCLLALAQLAFDLMLPSEEAGSANLESPDRDEHWVRRLFEKAIAGYYRLKLVPRAWAVTTGKILRWQTAEASEGIEAILPTMKIDIALEDQGGRLIVIDTKFTEIVRAGWLRDERLKSNYLYQLYAYLRSQEPQHDSSTLLSRAEGILVHPAVERALDESVVIQGHRIRFMTVDLCAAPQEIRRVLESVVLN